MVLFFRTLNQGGLSKTKMIWSLLGSSGMIQFWGLMLSLAVLLSDWLLRISGRPELRFLPRRGVVLSSSGSTIRLSFHFI